MISSNYVRERSWSEAEMPSDGSTQVRPPVRVGSTGVLAILKAGNERGCGTRKETAQCVNTHLYTCNFTVELQGCSGIQLPLLSRLYRTE